MTQKKYTKKKAKRASDYWSKCDPIVVYNAVVTGELKKFPNNYMTKPIAKVLVKHVIIDGLDFKREDICKKLNFPLLSEYNLGGVRKRFEDCIYTMVNYIFEDMKIFEWELNKVTANFWEKEENRIRFIIWVAEKEELDIRKIKDVRKINADLINEYGGSKMLKESDGLHSVIIKASGNLHKEWQFIKINTWTDKKAIEAVKWLIEEKLKWSREDVCANLTAETFYDNDLGGLLSKTCSNSPIKALEKAYPGQYKKEDLIRGEKKKKSIERMMESKNKLKKLN